MPLIFREIPPLALGAELAALTSVGIGATKAGIALTAEARSSQAARWGLGCLHSFASETPVLMADGTSKRIDEVKIGDQVLATDPVTGETTTRPVTATHRHVDTDLTDLTITAGQGNQAILRTTQHHQIWDNTLHTWTDASRLQPGHHLRTPNGETATLSASTNFTGAKTMHDLTVESVHTYHVLAGSTPVLVHNTDTCRVSSAVRDWATKGAHVHVGGDEIRVFPTGTGGIGAEGVRLRTGLASEKNVQAALDAIGSDPKLRADLIAKARSVMGE